MLRGLVKDYKQFFFDVYDEWADHLFSLKFDPAKAKRLVDFAYEGFNDNVEKVIVKSPVAMLDSCPTNDAGIIGGPHVEEKIRRRIIGIKYNVEAQLKSFFFPRFRSRYEPQIISQLSSRLNVEAKEFYNRVTDAELRKPDYEPRGQAQLRLVPPRPAYSRVLGSAMRQVFEETWRGFRHSLSPPRGNRDLNHFRFGINSNLPPRNDIAISTVFPYSSEDAYDMFYLDWVASYDAFQRLGMFNCDEFSTYRELMKANIFTWLPFSDYAVICMPPTFIRMDERGTLHRLSGPAVVFPDGYKQHWVRGVFFPADLFTKFFEDKSFTGRDILNLWNVEQKSVLIQHYGYDMLMDDLQQKIVLDVDEVISQVTGEPAKGELIDGVLDENRVRFVWVEDHTTHKVVTLGVPIAPETETCRGAIAWTFGMSEEEYTLDFES